MARFFLSLFSFHGITFLLYINIHNFFKVCTANAIVSRAFYLIIIYTGTVSVLSEINFRPSEKNVEQSDAMRQIGDVVRLQYSWLSLVRGELGALPAIAFAKNFAKRVATDNASQAVALCRDGQSADGCCAGTDVDNALPPAQMESSHAQKNRGKPVVKLITHHRMTTISEVHPYLVSASCQRFDQQQRSIVLAR